ncbi:MAG: hypothetical protein ISS33_05195 [Candidatus Omnitrophica bacterium]|nr:hypothetical protein [Candidatus Omnitrophota bacterium]
MKFDRRLRIRIGILMIIVSMAASNIYWIVRAGKKFFKNTKIQNAQKVISSQK